MPQCVGCGNRVRYASDRCFKCVSTHNTPQPALIPSAVEEPSPPSRRPVSFHPPEPAPIPPSPPTKHSPPRASSESSSVFYNVVWNPPSCDWPRLTERNAASPLDLAPRVRPILEAVRDRGDAAVAQYAAQFDRVTFDVPPRGSCRSSDPFRVSPSDLAAAGTVLTPSLRLAIETAYHNIRKFHAAQLEGTPAPLRPTPTHAGGGVMCWRRGVPIDAVGLYVPGGSAPLFSTALMLAVPAQLAGCRTIVLCTPPRSDGTVHPAVLYAANLCGITNVFRIGGVQAVAAMAYGTESVPKVMKVFGPGNAFVTAAKTLVAAEGVAAIDLPAGPSEVLVVADVSSEPEFVAADLLSQAEHGPDSQVVLVVIGGGAAATGPDGPTKAAVRRIHDAVQRQVDELPRRDIAVQSLAASVTAVFPSLREGMAFSNAYAPEHLILNLPDAAAEAAADMVSNAGSVFVGKWTCESAGDYASGTNHTLPTAGAARYTGGVSVDMFRKAITFQRISEAGLRSLGPHIDEMARAEGLDAHARAVTRRLATLAPTHVHVQGRRHY
eukprot:TRINITY_DN246_c0_g1_i2.p1 TRINITY_DN246_c0_g1~~TRINITY_DN246_c0_g1_i2.p1  ORF type:complete len:551 (-),score=104.21 TRINITY_DN246_c0_g1_i2:2365-4017(-)